MTIERPGEILHNILVNRGMCVSHNGARWIDLMYVNRTIWNKPFVRPAACHAVEEIPNYVKPSDMC